jgi:SAM-dependent methyltransferase
MKTDFLTTVDVRNLALQRTGSLLRFPIPKPFSPSYFLWCKLGLNALLDLEARVRREAIIQFSVGEIRDEFERILDATKVQQPLRILDIGCGLGIVDILFAERCKVDRILLVDIEENERKHHGFAEQGAAYNSLEKAQRLVHDNVAPSVTVQSVNPQKEALTAERFGTYNLIVSFISCGFHYPADLYLDVFDTMLDPDGRLILDLRLEQDHGALLSRYEVESLIEQTKAYRRVVLRRMSAAN